jgi:hypothetical protein
MNSPADSQVKPTDPQPEDLRTIYKELCTSYRAIDDFRSKLLGFLPLATGAGIFLLLDKLKDGGSLPVEAKSHLPVVGGFGFLITSGLFLYEIYGIKKCCALIQAGRKMECSLHNDGQFITRPQNVALVINEPFAAGVIYPAVLAAWMYFALIFVCPKDSGIPILISLSVFIAGLVCTLIYDFQLRGRVDELDRCDISPPKRPVLK